MFSVVKASQPPSQSRAIPAEPTSRRMDSVIISRIFCVYLGIIKTDLMLGCCIFGEFDKVILL